MELRHLRSFVAVAREESFTRAAESLHISQPPLSQRIQELERELGVKLFDRHSRKVSLSHAGSVLFEEVQKLLIQLDSAVEACRQVARGNTGQLAIGFTGRASQDMLPKLVRFFRNSFPQVVLDFQGPSETGVLETNLLNGRIDIALCFLPIGDQRVSSRPLMTCEFALALPNAHPLASTNVPDLRNCATEPFVGYPSNGRWWLRKVMDDYCHSAGFNPRVVRETASSQVLLCLVAAGVGISVVPTDLMFLGSVDGVCFRHLSPGAIDVKHGMAWLKNNKNPTLLNLTRMEQSFLDME